MGYHSQPLSDHSACRTSQHRMISATHHLHLIFAPGYGSPSLEDSHFCPSPSEHITLPQLGSSRPDHPAFGALLVPWCQVSISALRISSWSDASNVGSLAEYLSSSLRAYSHAFAVLQSFDRHCESAPRIALGSLDKLFSRFVLDGLGGRRGWRILSRLEGSGRWSRSTRRILLGAASMVLLLRLSFGKLWSLRDQGRIAKNYRASCGMEMPSEWGN